MLTRFFELCASEAPENQIAKTMIYQDIPKEFRWDSTLGSPQTIPSHAWEDGSRVAKGHGVVLFAHFSASPQGLAVLRAPSDSGWCRVRNIPSSGFEIGLLEDDAEWISCMREAAVFRMPYQLRQLFTTILVYSQVAEVRQLWERFYDDISQAFAHRYPTLLGQAKEDMIMFETLKSLNELVQISG
ncbi:unnamed protein product [Phytophthora fragariaefolia]|uniref:Unnamed protein product n=1 Tax=Phytophthora fragariaefolia TaxID=1490495 RepID=A0A9W6XMU6_9STRA|nr:unnamed protein product [Phytophthora fragariaefolia]